MFTSFAYIGFKDSFGKEKRKAQFTFYGFTKFISHISFSIVCVNCAFGFVSDYAIVASFSLLV